MVLAGQSLDVWQGVDALVGSNFCQPVRGDAHVRPVDVPVCVFVRVAADVHLATHTLHHVVAAVLRAQHKARLSICACPLFLLLLEGDFAFGLGGAGWEAEGSSLSESESLGSRCSWAGCFWFLRKWAGLRWSASLVGKLSRVRFCINYIDLRVGRNRVGSTDKRSQTGNK